MPECRYTKQSESRWRFFRDLVLCLLARWRRCGRMEESLTEFYRVFRIHYEAPQRVTIRCKTAGIFFSEKVIFRFAEFSDVLLMRIQSDLMRLDGRHAP